MSSRVKKLSNSLLTGVLYQSSIAYNNYIYTAGGGVNFNSPYSPATTVQAAEVFSNDDIGPWISQPSLPNAVMGAEMVQWSNWIGLFGGSDGAVNPTNTNAIRISRIYGNGQLGPWVTQGNALPVAMSYSDTFITQKSVYLVGGTNATVTATLFVQSTAGGSGITYTAVTAGTGGNAITIQYATPSGTGSVVITGTAILVTPAAAGTNTTVLAQIQANINASGLVTGVITGTASDPVVLRAATALAGGVGGPLSTIYKALLNAEGSIGPWTLVGNLPAPLQAWGCTAYFNNFLFVVNGSTLYTAYLTDETGLGPWKTSGLPFTRSNSQETAPTTIAFGGFLIIIGGSDASFNPQASIKVGAINADGSVGAFRDNGNLIGERSAQSLTLHNDVLLISGGINTTSVLNDVQIIRLASINY